MSSRGFLERSEKKGCSESGGNDIAKSDILEHELVPKHEIMDEKEVKAVLEKYHITKGQLPKIMSNDPVVKRITANVGDVIRITRDSKTAGRSVFYRVVVAHQV